jgi:hypothetical protein
MVIIISSAIQCSRPSVPPAPLTLGTAPWNSKALRSYTRVSSAHACGQNWAAGDALRLGTTEACAYAARRQGWAATPAPPAQGVAPGNPKMMRLRGKCQAHMAMVCSDNHLKFVCLGIPEP